VEQYFRKNTIHPPWGNVETIDRKIFSNRIKRSTTALRAYTGHRPLHFSCAGRGR